MNINRQMRKWLRDIPSPIREQYAAELAKLNAVRKAIAKVRAEIRRQEAA